MSIILTRNLVSLAGLFFVKNKAKKALNTSAFSASSVASSHFSFSNGLKFCPLFSSFFEQNLFLMPFMSLSNLNSFCLSDFTPTQSCHSFLQSSLFYMALLHFFCHDFTRDFMGHWSGPDEAIILASYLFFQIWRYCNGTFNLVSLSTFQLSYFLSFQYFPWGPYLWVPGVAWALSLWNPLDIFGCFPIPPFLRIGNIYHITITCTQITFQLYTHNLFLLELHFLKQCSSTLQGLDGVSVSCCIIFSLRHTWIVQVCGYHQCKDFPKAWLGNRAPPS